MDLKNDMIFDALDFNKLLMSSFLLVVLDYAYLSSHASYFNYIFENIQGSFRINKLGVFLCYVALVALLNYFIIQKYRKISGRVIFEAFFLGATTYLIYEATNLATFKDWPMYMVIVDSVWGGILFSIVSYLTIKYSSEK